MRNRLAELQRSIGEEHALLPDLRLQQAEREAHEHAMQTAALEAGLEATADATARLAALAEHRQADRRLLQAKHAQILSFGDGAARKQELIQTLIRENASYKRTLVETVGGISGGVAARYSAVQHDIAGLVSKLTGRVSLEDDAFENTALRDLRHAVEDDGTARKVGDFSINRLDRAGYDDASVRRYDALYDSLYGRDMLKHHQGADSIIPACIALKQAARKEAAKLEHASIPPGRTDSNEDRDGLSARPRSRPADFLGRIDRLVVAKERTMLDKHVPDLEACVRDADAAIRQATQGHTLVDEWINMPGQYVLPDFKRSGLNAKEWHEKIQLSSAGKERPG